MATMDHDERSAPKGEGRAEKLLWISACGKDSSRTARALISLLNYAAEMKQLFTQGLGGGGEELKKKKKKGAC